jgi:hypothetical protein
MAQSMDTKQKSSDDKMTLEEIMEFYGATNFKGLCREQRGLLKELEVINRAIEQLVLCTLTKNKNDKKQK